MARPLPTPGSVITALLGPTNTGKTHRCVSRMLDYDTAMIGLPLRLLAREVYDRVVREVGSESVALVTGEERIVPSRARYWVCTTEAMPTQLDVDFLAVDEIQLAAHPTRGHVFTERLLHARGRFETWFLGASTMRRVIEDLVPSANFKTAERLSRLSFAGACALGQVPTRSAVVAFSVPQVYALAERLRVRKGGVAVVLGALSPKTRNAQVGMYQAGEVDHVVATDAIGMGLNMSISHVALASLHKFDGRAQRALSAAELAQIAGRAGRSIHDGTFGTLEPAWLDASVAREIENHQFPPLTQVLWRNRDLDFSSLDALLSSLHMPPPHARLKLVHQAPDAVTLARIAQRNEAKPLARGQDAVRLLWDICQIPDYRQLTPELHTDLLFTIFDQVVNSGGQIADDWMFSQLDNLNQTTGDIDTLVARIAFVRTWTYVSQRHDWVKHAEHWRQHTRALEDALSDALHERLIARFVSRRRASNSLGAQPRGEAWTTRKPPRDVPTRDSPSEWDTGDSNHPFAALRNLHVRIAPSAPSAQPAQESPTWRVTAAGELERAGVRVAALIAGPTVTHPRVQILTEDSGKQRGVLQEAAQRAVRQHVETLLDSFEPRLQDSSAVRGIFYQLQGGLGSVERAAVEPLLGALNEVDIRRLGHAGIVVGRLSVYGKRLLKPFALRHRLGLVRTFFGKEALPDVASLGAVSVRPPNGRSRNERSVAMCLGYVATRGSWVRCDVAERALSLDEDIETPSAIRQLTSILGCKQPIALRVIGELRQRAGLPAVSHDRASRDASRRDGARRNRTSAATGIHEK